MLPHGLGQALGSGGFSMFAKRVSTTLTLVLGLTVGLASCTNPYADIPRYDPSKDQRVVDQSLSSPDPGFPQTQPIRREGRQGSKAQVLRNSDRREVIDYDPGRDEYFSP